MKLFYFFLISLLFSTSLFSDSKYLLITKTSNQNELPYIKAKLKALELNMVAYKDGAQYTVYSGAFKSNKAAIIGLQRVKEYYPEATVVSFDADAKESQTTYSSTPKYGYFFVNGSFAFLSTPLEQSAGDGNITINPIGLNAMGYALEAGYNFENSMFVTLGYLSAASSSNTISNIYGTLNYKMRIARFEPYAGVLGGLSTLGWTKPPMGTATSGADSAMMYGIQTGLNYDTGFKNLVLFANYQYTFMNHKTPLTNVTTNTTTKVTTITDSLTLAQNIMHGVNFGVQYRF